MLRSVLSDIQKLRINLSNTRFHLISKNREELCQTREGVFHLISKHQEVIYQTRGGSVSSDTQTTRR